MVVADLSRMLMVELVALLMIMVIAISAGVSALHILIQRLAELTMERTARVEASGLDDELRRFNGS